MSALNYDIVYTELKQWLNAKRPDYNEGLALFLSYTSKPAQYEQLATYRDVTKLHAALMAVFQEVKGKMAKAPAPIGAVLPAAQKTRNTAPPVAATPVRGDKVQQQLQAEWIELIKQIEHTRNQLYYIGRDAVTGKERNVTLDEKEQRKKLAAMLVGPGGLNDQCLRNRDAKQYYETFGVLPDRQVNSPAAAIQPQIEGDVYLLKENARRQVYKLKGKIAKAEKALETAIGTARKSLLDQLAGWRAKLELAEQMHELYKSKLSE